MSSNSGNHHEELSSQKQEKDSLSPMPEEYKQLKRRPSLKDIHPKEYTDYKKAFDMFDQNKDGFIDHVELLEVLKAIGHNPTHSELLDVFRDVDKNNDGKIEFREFLYLMRQSMVVDEIQAAFNLIDVGKTGKVGIKEIKHLMSLIGESLTDAEIKAIIKVADGDGDGYITQQEFAQAMANLEPREEQK
jgi:calmodulin